MYRASGLVAKELTESQQQILQAVINQAIHIGKFFDGVEDMTEYLRANNVAEHLLADEYLKARTDLWIRSLRPTTGASERIPTGSSATQRPHRFSPPSFASGGQILPNKREIIPSDISLEPASGGEALIWRTLFVSMSCDDGPPWNGFSCRVHQQLGDFIKAETASRLQLTTTIGTKHKLAWKIHVDGRDTNTQQSLFTIVANDALDVDVALGVDWLCHGIEGQSEMGDVAVIAPDEEQIDGEVELCLSRQSQHILQGISQSSNDAEIPTLVQAHQTLVKTHSVLANMLRKPTDAMIHHDLGVTQQPPALPDPQGSNLPRRKW